jgi:hypothetical protein
MLSKLNTFNKKDNKKASFLRQFRDESNREFRLLTAAQFTEIWNHYDIDSRFIYLLSSDEF